MISPLRNYRLCWHVNKALRLDLIRKPDLEVTDNKKRVHAHFALFTYEDEINFVQYNFIGNKSSGIFLIPELKEVDYLLLMRGDAAGRMKQEVMGILKNTSGIQALFEMNPAGLRSKQNLIFE